MGAGPGYVRLDTGFPNHAFRTPQVACLLVRVQGPPQSAAYSLRLAIHDLAFTRRLDRPRTIEHPWVPGEPQPLAVDLGLNEAGAAYEVTAELRAGDELVDHSVLRVAVRDSRPPVTVKDE